MLHLFSGERSLSISIWVKIVLCAWMGVVVLLFVILFWPPYLVGLAQGLGILDKLQLLQNLIGPFFRASYLS